MTNYIFNTRNELDEAIEAWTNNKENAIKLMEKLILGMSVR